MIYELLQQGRENAISQERLRDVLGFADTREVRRQVEVERRAGRLILSTTIPPGGYYLPSDILDVREYVKANEKRVKGSLITLRSARRYLREIEGQEKLNL